MIGWGDFLIIYLRIEMGEVIAEVFFIYLLTLFVRQLNLSEHSSMENTESILLEIFYFVNHIIPISFNLNYKMLFVEFEQH